MPRWSPEAALRLEEAAITLFAENGYSATTVPQIAERAGLTTRTFFRHFSDKREVLFLRDREFPRVVREALIGVPDSVTGLALIEVALSNVAGELERWREPMMHRRGIVRAEENLRERELLKLDRLADATFEALVERGLPEGEARVLSRLAAAVFDIGLDRWLTGTPASRFADGLAQTFADLRRAV